MRASEGAEGSIGDVGGRPLRLSEPSAASVSSLLGKRGAADALQLGGHFLPRREAVHAAGGRPFFDEEAAGEEYYDGSGGADAAPMAGHRLGTNEFVFKNGTLHATLSADERHLDFTTLESKDGCETPGAMADGSTLCTPVLEFNNANASRFVPRPHQAAVRPT